MTDLDTFTLSYIETALWSSTGDDERPLDADYGPDDLSPDCLAKMTEDCRAFQELNQEVLAGLDDERAGHDFWLTRCGHGAGFCDGDYEEPAATLLTDSSHNFGEVDLYVGDDGLIYLA